MSETAKELRYLAGLSEFARTTPKRPPMHLASYIRKAGGLQDWHGEITNLTGGKRYRGFGLVNHDGLTLDDAALWAWEAGFIVSESRPTIAEFLDYLDRDLNGDHVFALDDWPKVENWRAAEEARNELDELGILADTPAKQRRVEKALIAAAVLLDKREASHD